MNQSTLLLIGALISVVAVGIILLQWEKGRAARRIKRSRKQGRAGEERALKWLKKKGYKVTEQVSVDEVYHVDSIKKTFTIRPDIFATKGKEKWVIEVKTGKAGNPNNRQTRRQLREYAAYFPTYNLGLINGDAEHIKLHTIEFDPVEIAYVLPFKWITLLIGLGAVLGVSVTLVMR